VEVLAASQNLNLDPAYFSIPQTISWPTTEGQEAYGYYYPPQVSALAFLTQIFHLL
jgi:dipeptidyl aminopeptidase/acylaminoacyl peptidase